MRIWSPAARNGGLAGRHQKGPRALPQPRQLFLQRARGGCAVEAVGIALVAPLAARFIVRRVLEHDGGGAMHRHTQRIETFGADRRRDDALREIGDVVRGHSGILDRN